MPGYACSSRSDNHSECTRFAQPLSVGRPPRLQAKARTKWPTGSPSSPFDQISQGFLKSKHPHVPIVKPLPTELNPSASQSHCFWNWLIWNYAIGLVALMALSIPTSERVELTGRSTWPGATRLPMHIENQGKVLPRWGRTLHQSSVPCKQFLGTDLASWKLFI